MKKIALILLISLIGVSSFAQKKEKEKKKSKKELKAEAEAAKNKVLLRYTLKKGESYEQNMENESKVQVMGMDVLVVQKISTKNLITDVDASGNLSSETLTEKFYIKQSLPMGEMEYDSEDANKQSPELSEQFGKVKGTKVTMKMSPTGKMLETDQNLNMPSGSNQFPEKAVGVGDTWEMSSTSKNQMLGNKEMTSNNQYKLVERTGGKAIIEVTGKVVSEGKEIGTFSGKMTVEEATGIVLESNILQKMNTEIQGMEAQIEANIKVKGKKL